MVDLAGSEKDPFSFSQPHMAGSMMEGSASANNYVKLDEEVESRWIRRSLATLGQIIQSLSRGVGDRQHATTSIATTTAGGGTHGARYSGGGGGGGGGGQNALPYRDSALTWLLRNSLSGR